MSNKKRALKNVGDSVVHIGRFDPRQVVRFTYTPEAGADFSHTDGANLEVVKPAAKRRTKVKSVIENTKPEL